MRWYASAPRLPKDRVLNRCVRWTYEYVGGRWESLEHRSSELNVTFSGRGDLPIDVVLINDRPPHNYRPQSVWENA